MGYVGGHSPLKYGNIIFCMAKLAALGQQMSSECILAKKLIHCLANVPAPSEHRVIDNPQTMNRILTSWR